MGKNQNKWNVQSREFLEVFKYSQIISSEIKFSKLVETLLSVMVKITSASKASLILPQAGKLVLQGVHPIEACPKGLLLPTDVENDPRISIKIARSVNDSHKTITSPGILCAPILRANEIIGILYLEHTDGKTLFSPEHIFFIELLAAQVAISIENAHLYQLMENRIAERSKDLKNTQQKLIFSGKMAALGEMAGGIAHEINNPLAIIQMSADQISEIARSAEINYEVLGKKSSIISRTVFRIIDIIEGLRVFSRDTTKEPFRPISLKLIVEETLKFCAEKIKAHAIDLRVDEISDELVVMVRATQISQVILNLINNAADAIEKNSNKWIRVKAVLRDNFVDLHVIDSGTGISQELREKIFQPFFTTKDIGKGTGLGLSISSGIIKDHGGEITIETFEGNTDFKVSLPINNPKLE